MTFQYGWKTHSGNSTTPAPKAPQAVLYLRREGLRDLKETQNNPVAGRSSFRDEPRKTLSVLVGAFLGWILSLGNFGFPRSFWQYLVQPQEYLSTQKGRQEGQVRKVCGLAAREHLHIKQAKQDRGFLCLVNNTGLSQELKQD